jgi:DNA-binding response OmpR family regulator
MVRYRSQSRQQRQFRQQFNRCNTPDRQYALSLEVAESTPFSQLEQFILKSFRKESQAGPGASPALPQPTSFVLGTAEGTLPEPSEDFILLSPAPGPAQTSLTCHSAPPEGGFILVVEDDMPMEHLEGYLLESAGHSVQTAASGEEALEILEQASPALVLMDVGLPGMDGLTACQRIRESSQVSIIMVTGKDRVEDQVRALEVGADDYLVKAFLAKELTIRVAVLLRLAELRGRVEQPDLPIEGLEDLYEGKVRVVAEVTGSMRKLIDFVGELRDNEQLSLLRLSTHQNRVDLRLRLRRPLPLKKMFLEMDSVWKLAPPVESEGEGPDPLICLSLCQ